MRRKKRNKSYEHYHELSSNNLSDIKESKMCGCFFCLEMFPPSKIEDLINENDGERTVGCPFCGIDSVLGDKSVPLTKELLVEMKEYWF